MQIMQDVTVRSSYVLICNAYWRFFAVSSGAEEWRRRVYKRTL